MLRDFLFHTTANNFSRMCYSVKFGGILEWDDSPVWHSYFYDPQGFHNFFR